MSWTPKSEGKIKGINRKYNDYSVLNETVTTKEGTAVFGSAFSVPPGRDFSVLMNSAATNLSASTHVELWVSMDNVTYYRWNKAGFNATSALIDTATVILVYDVSEYGQFPYYKLKFPSAGGSVTNVVTVNGIQDVTL